MRFFAASPFRSSDCKQVLSRGLIRNAFPSYLYGPAMPLIRSLTKGLVVVDSGAHTFFSESSGEVFSVHVNKPTNKPKDKKVTLSQVETYMQSYAAWLRVNLKDMDYFVELDVGELVGQQRVLGWREKLRDLGLADKCIIVWHPKVESYDDFRKAAVSWPSRYVAIEGLRQYRWAADYIAFAKDLYKCGILCHGFALMKPEVMIQAPLYSVDASTFLSGSQWGYRYKFNPGTGGLSTHGTGGADNISPKKRIRSYFETAKHSEHLLPPQTGPAASEFAERVELLTLNLRAINEMEDFYTNHWERRGIKWEKVRKSKRSRRIS